MKKFISLLIIVSIISCNILTPSKALSFSLLESKLEYEDKDLSFNTIYPASFWSSTTGIILKYTGIAVAAFMFTYFTAGAGGAVSAGIIAKFIGGSIGTYILGLSGGAAINAGLAFLGGGAVAAGGLGILGGISVVSAVSSVALTAALSNAFSQIPSGTHKKTITLIKPRLFWDNISPSVDNELKELKSTLEEISKNGGTEKQAKKITRLLKKIDKRLNQVNTIFTNKHTAYNYLFLAIIRYNMNDFEGSKEAVINARKYADPEKSSVLDYV